MNFEGSIIRQELSSRGGGIEISLDAFGFIGEKMSAFQNYLGGGLLGSIQSNDTVRRQTLRSQVSDIDNAELDEISELLKQYFHSLTNPDTEWESMSYDQNQKMPSSSY